MSTPAKGKYRHQPAERATPAWVLTPPTIDDLIHLLRAWRVWFLGGLVGATLGAALYAVAPPPYRVRATVNVDFHLEQAWPQNSDREQFYYLERETRKLVEIAQSDEALGAVAQAVPGITVQELRAGAAQLSQPGNGGWHFYGIDRDAQRASIIASSWARAFSSQVDQKTATGGADGLEKFITAEPTQLESLAAKRSVGLGTYMLVSALIVSAILALGLLLIHPRR